jgi:predicted nucleotidyltransferase
MKLMSRDEILSLLHQYKERNRKKYSIINLGLFGSASRKAMNEQSDIDIVVELEDPDMFNLISIKQDLEEELSRSVDIVRYREKMNAFLKAKIEKEAVYV